jgi:lycopene beta-cyclase
MVVAAWREQEVRFPGYVRVLDTGYNAISAEQLDRVVAPTLGDGLKLETSVTALEKNGAVLANGEVLSAALIIDGRGALADQPLAAGFQKFVGLEVETETPHRQERPIIMDATVEQAPGYRFVYTLPLSRTRLLIEETFYSESAELDTARIEADVVRYAEARGWQIARVVRREKGVLPITLAGDIDEHWRRMGDSPRSGLRAWLFHATTGYSLPFAVALADEVAREPKLTSDHVASLIERRSRDAWANQSFFRMLNRFLFVSARPEQRVAVMARFYKLPQPLIERFYAGRLTHADKAQILIGSPPVSLIRAFGSISERAGWQFAAQHQSETSRVELG